MFQQLPGCLRKCQRVGHGTGFSAALDSERGFLTILTIVEQRISIWPDLVPVFWRTPVTLDRLLQLPTCFS